MVVLPPRLATPWPDVTLGPWTFRDVGTVPRRDRGRAKKLLAEMHATQLPPEIHCDVAGAEVVTGEVLLNQGRGAAAVRAFLALERVSEEEMLGDVRPMRFAAYRNGKVRGGFEWYAIRVVGTGPAERRLRAMPYPAFQRMFREVEPQMSLTADVCEAFLSHPGVVAGGVLHRFVRVRTFTFVDPTRAKNLRYRTTAAWDQEVDGRSADLESNLSVDLTVEPSGRERRTITWS